MCIRDNMCPAQVQSARYSELDRRHETAPEVPAALALFSPDHGLHVSEPSLLPPSSPGAPHAEEPRWDRRTGWVGPVMRTTPADGPAQKDPGGHVRGRLWAPAGLPESGPPACWPGS